MIHGGADVGDLAVEHFGRIRFDLEVDRLILMDQIRVFFLNRGFELQWIHFDDVHHLRIFANVFAALNRSLRDGAFDRRSDDRVIQLLFRQIESCSPILQTRL